MKEFRCIKCNRLLAKYEIKEGTLELRCRLCKLTQKREFKDSEYYNKESI